MKISHLIFIFLFSTILQAQIKSGEVIYGLELGFEPNESSQKDNSSGNSTLRDMIRGSEKDLAEVKGILKFNSQESFFSKEVPMQNDNNPSLNISLTLLGLRGGGYYLNNTKNLKLEIKESFGKTFLIEDIAFNKEDWTISPEIRNIGNFVVYKATSKKVVKNSKGTFTHKVIAWFAPELPFSFGPIGYGGLPGLILELEVLSNFPAKYTVESTNFSKESIEINIPKGKKVSPSELDGMARKAMDNLRNN